MVTARLDDNIARREPTRVGHDLEHLPDQRRLHDVGKLLPASGADFLGSLTLMTDVVAVDADHGPAVEGVPADYALRDLAQRLDDCF